MKKDKKYISKSKVHFWPSNSQNRSQFFLKRTVGQSPSSNNI
jgi:hypothetical protein